MKFTMQKMIVKLLTSSIMFFDQKRNIFFIDSVAKNMVEVLPRHQLKINEMKKDGYQNNWLLQKIRRRYRKQSQLFAKNGGYFIQKIISRQDLCFPLSSTKQQFRKHDLGDKNEILSKLYNIHGCTIEFLEFLRNNAKICVIAVDYAGLTTNVTDLKKLLT